MVDEVAIEDCAQYRTDSGRGANLKGKEQVSTTSNTGEPEPLVPGTTALTIAIHVALS